MILSSVNATINSKTKPRRDPHHLLLEGKFLAEKNITYTIYKMDREGTFVKESRNKAKRTFSIKCNVGDRYIVRFEDKKHNVKFLMMDITKSGKFTIDVDFSIPYDAVLKFTAVGYRLTRLVSNPVANN